MSKKHFEAIAEDFRHMVKFADNVDEVIILRCAAQRLADTFEGFNDHFDRARFLEACGF